MDPLQHCPRLLSWIKGPIFKGRRGEGRKWREREKGREWRGAEGRKEKGWNGIERERLPPPE